MTEFHHDASRSDHFECRTDIDAYEKAKLEAYVDTIPGVDTIQDPVTGAIMYYLVEEKNDSTSIAKDSVVTVGYKGYFTDGTIFDESNEDNPFIFTVGAAEGAIEGWNLGIPRFKEGEKGRLFIPYQLAYGESGSKVSGAPNYFSMLPYETLIFDIEVLEVNQSGD